MRLMLKIYAKKIYPMPKAWAYRICFIGTFYATSGKNYANVHQNFRRMGAKLHYCRQPIPAHSLPPTHHPFHYVIFMPLRQSASKNPGCVTEMPKFGRWRRTGTSPIPAGIIFFRSSLYFSSSALRLYFSSSAFSWQCRHPIDLFFNIFYKF